MFFPSVIEKTGRNIKSFDLPTKLLQERIIYLNEVDDISSASVVMQLLWLNSDNDSADINLYINSPGGVITSGMAIYDTINAISNKVNTIAIGQACSMGAFLLSSGTGLRGALKHSRIMIHQPSGGAGGMASDIEIQFNEIQRMKIELAHIMSKNSKGKSTFEKITNMSDRDTFLSAEECLNLGIIDKVIESI